LRLTIARYYTPSGRSIHRDEKKGTGGITPDIEVKVTLEDEKKLIQQSEELFYPGKEKKEEKSKKLGANDKISPEKKKDAVIHDDVLDRAVELLKARDVLGNLKTAK
jgi:C-terminal processing protease CtpA/Prc